MCRCHMAFVARAFVSMGARTRSIHPPLVPQSQQRLSVLRSRESNPSRLPNEQLLLPLWLRAILCAFNPQLARRLCSRIRCALLLRSGNRKLKLGWDFYKEKDRLDREWSLMVCSGGGVSNDHSLALLKAVWATTSKRCHNEKGVLGTAGTRIGRQRCRGERIKKRAHGGTTTESGRKSVVGLKANCVTNASKKIGQTKLREWRANSVHTGSLPLKHRPKERFLPPPHPWFSLFPLAPSSSLAGDCCIGQGCSTCSMNAPAKFLPK